jgi:hypothetical protein
MTDAMSCFDGFMDAMEERFTAVLLWEGVLLGHARNHAYRQGEQS